MHDFERTPNVAVRIHGFKFRVCVYRTTGGWSSFVEDRYFRGGTGDHPTARLAFVAALRRASTVARNDTRRPPYDQRFQWPPMTPEPGGTLHDRF